MYRSIRKVIEFVIFALVAYKFEERYRKRLREDSKGLRIYIVLQTMALLVVYTAINEVVKPFVGASLYEEINDTGINTFLLWFIFQIKKFIFCKRERIASMLIPIVQKYKQVEDTDVCLPETGIKEEELLCIKNHIQYILGHIEEYAPSIPAGKLKFKFQKEGKKYYVSIKYSCYGEQREIFDVAQAELKECIRRLAYIYEIERDSFDDWEKAKVYFSC